MRDLKNLKGAKILSKIEQKVIKGGKIMCTHFCEPMANCCTPEDVCGTLGPDGKCYAY